VIQHLVQYVVFHGCRAGFFRAAIVRCTKKSRMGAVPLDHRPIALLNADYKINTHEFAMRSRSRLPDLFHPLQAGFVPGRSIHTPIDTFFAVRKLANLNPHLTKANAFLLESPKGTVGDSKFSISVSDRYVDLLFWRQDARKIGRTSSPAPESLVRTIKKFKRR